MPNFSSTQVEMLHPAHGGAAVIPSDTADFSRASRFLWVGTAGTIKVRMLDGQDLTFKVAVGRLDLRVTRVFATGTTAGDIVALW